MCPRAQRTLLAINLKKYPWQDIFLNVNQKESFFVASDVATILYNKPCIYTGE